jgi:hypothetical protein
MTSTRQRSFFGTIGEAGDGSSCGGLILGLFQTPDFFLECLDLVPGLEPFAHNTKVELLHENEILVHIKEHITCDFLFLENFAVFGIHSELSHLLGGFSLIPLPNLFLSGNVTLLLVCLIPINV